MSKISTYLDNIKKAVYGKDVRQSIHDAIKQCYEDVNSPELHIEAFEKAVQHKIDDGSMSYLSIEENSIDEKKINRQSYF